MKTTKVKFEVTSGENGDVTIRYTCLYKHPELSDMTAEISPPGTHQIFQVGTVKCPEWGETGHVFLRGCETEHDNDVITRQFQTEGLARSALWMALYGLSVFEARARKHKVVPDDADDQTTVIIVNGKEWQFDDAALQKFISILR